MGFGSCLFCEISLLFLVSLVCVANSRFCLFWEIPFFRFGLEWITPHSIVGAKYYFSITGKKERSGFYLGLDRSFIFYLCMILWFQSKLLTLIPHFFQVARVNWFPVNREKYVCCRYISASVSGFWPIKGLGPGFSDPRKIQQGSAHAPPPSSA